MDITKIRPGDVIITCELSDPNSIRSYTVTSLNLKQKTVTVDNNKELVFYVAFCWPIAYAEELRKILRIRQVYKKAYDDSIKLIYELGNKITREGF